MAQDALNTFAQPSPALLLTCQLFSAIARKSIESGLPVLLSRAPFRPDPTVLLHPVKRRIKRALFNPEQLCGYALNVSRNRIAVHSASSSKRLQYEKRECALQYVVPLSLHHPPRRASSSN